VWKHFSLKDITMTTSGKLVVIDGTDGSGKGTHSEMLIARLTREGRPVELADFPRYGNPSAYFVEKYLRGEYGTADEVGPYRASEFYALDRYDASFAMQKSLHAGIVIISNRYVSSNMGHQAGKIADPVEREQFLVWLKDLEYGKFQMPQPDANILLYVPPEVGQQLVAEKSTRPYTHGKTHDIHEADIAHLRNASEAYREVAAREGWKVINCMEADNVTLRTKEDIHEEIYNYLQEQGIF
jgi:dTMP kinase